MECVYDNGGIVSKASLRAEIQDLKGQLEEADALLDALKTDPTRTGLNDAANIIIRGLDRGDSRGSIVKRLNGIDEKGNDFVPSLPQESSCSTVGADSAVEITDVVPPKSLTKDSSRPTTLSRPTSRGTDSDDTSSAGSVGSGTSYGSPASVTSHRLFASSTAADNAELSLTSPVVQSPSPPQDTWTSSGWTKQYIMGLITSVLEWDALPLCRVNKGLLLKDFESGARQYCSSALVNALLAIATRLVEESDKQSEVLSDTSTSTSETFVRESSAHLHGEGPTIDTLPNIQAVGVLALYEASFGQDARASKLADEYAAAIADLCFSEPTPVPGSDYDQVRTDAYHGAISLRRCAFLQCNDPLPSRDRVTRY